MEKPCYCCGTYPCIVYFGEVAKAEFEAQLRKGNKQYAPPIPRNGPRDDTPFLAPYTEETTP